MPLTHLKVERAKPKEKQYKLADERGMYLLIHPKGGKWWRLDYRYQGKRKTLSLGTYPDVSIKVARKKRDDARSILDGGSIQLTTENRTKSYVSIPLKQSPESGSENSAGNGLTIMRRPRWAVLRKIFFPGSALDRLLRSNHPNFFVSIKGLRNGAP